jgi:hypothetical protein
MNIVLKHPDDSFTIVSVLKDKMIVKDQPVDGFSVRTARMWPDGKVHRWEVVAKYLTLKEAEARAKTLAMMKRKHRDCVEVFEDRIPSGIKKAMAAPVEAQVTGTELISLVMQARKERYVTLKDIVGLEDFFDAGVEYVGYTTDDANILDVFDRFGKSRGVRIDRIDKVSKTEQCIESETVRLDTAFLNKQI